MLSDLRERGNSLTKRRVTKTKPEDIAKMAHTNDTMKRPIEAATVVRVTKKKHATQASETLCGYYH